MSNRAVELFALIQQEGEAAVDRFIAEGVSEELFLDFKLSANNGASKSLDPTDRRNLAKAISGFGNSEGGVIIWGVNCRQNADGADIPSDKKPLERPDRFKSWLEGITSGLTVPAHAGVRHHAFLANGCADKGYVVTLVPMSDHAPHQTVPDARYFMRAGSNFLPVPHAVLAGMFGRRPQPRMSYQWSAQPPGMIGADGVQLKFRLILNNLGPGIAETMFVNLGAWKHPGENCRLEFSRPDADDWRGQFTFGQHLSIIARDGVRLPPKAWLMPVEMILTLEPPFASDLEIEGECGAIGSEIVPIKISVSALELRAAVEAFCAKALKPDLRAEANAALHQAILKPPA